MTFLRNLFAPRSDPAAVDPNLAKHDQIITILEGSLRALRAANPEPFAARIRGDYPKRRTRVVRTHLRSADHD